MVLSMGKFGHLHSQKDIVWMLDVDKILFPECVARVPVSLWGFGGLRVCSPDVAQLSATARNRPQPSGTVRNRSREVAIWCLWQVLQKRSLLEVSNVA